MLHEYHKHYTMVSWIKRNKGKILILYAIKAVLFIPSVAYSATEYSQDLYVGYQLGDATTFSTEAIYNYKTEDKTGVYFTPTSIINRVEIPYPEGYATTTIDCTQIKINTSLVADYPATNNVASSTCVFSGTALYSIGVGVTGVIISHGAQLYKFAYATGTGYGFVMNTSDEVINFDRQFTIKFCDSDTCDGVFTNNVADLCESNPLTRIFDFAPADNSTTSNPVDFNLRACINPEDLGTIKGVNITLHNIDQNVLLLGSLSPSDIYLLRERDIDVAGLFEFSTSTTLGEGNYRLEVCIERSYFFGFIVNPLSSLSECESHQFIVESPTFIGNISQNIFRETNDFFAGLTATSSEALANTCNPISGNFGIRECTAYLFVPDAQTLNATMKDIRTGILTRVPWGYFTRIVSIISDTATTSLPSWTASVQIGAGNDMTPEITTITIDPSDMLVGGASLLESIHDPITDKTPREIFYPMVQLVIALGVIFTIVSDITHIQSSTEERKGKLS